ncbi:TPA: NUDIX hydrolase [bacterium]|nr:NUDIX hydrolase [bacterium]
MEKNKYWKVFVSCVIKCGDEILALKRKTGNYYGDYYDFPGGKMEYDESIEEAMVREVYEESGIKIKPQDLKLKAGITWRDDFKEETRYAVCFCFLHEVDIKPHVSVAKNEHTGYVWVKKDDPRLDQFLVDILDKTGV